MVFQSLGVVLALFVQTPLAVGSGSMLAAGLKSAEYDQSAVKVSVMKVPVPTPGQGQVLIKVLSSSINHLDLLWRVIDPSYMWTPFVSAWQAQGGYPKVLGLDAAGIVSDVGPGVSRLKVGDEVWTFNAAATVSDGSSVGGIAGHCWADYVAVDENMVSPKPKGMSFSEAGAVPLDALTALQALKSSGAPWKSGGAVLVLGATGGVGHFAVQLAKALGATKVIATASEPHRVLATSFGVDQFIDYHTSNWWDSSVVPDSSLVGVIDTVLQQWTGDRAFKKLKDHGGFASLCGGIPRCGAPMASRLTRWRYPTISQTAIRCTAGVCAGANQLDELRAYVDAGEFRVHIEREIPLSYIDEAITVLESGHAIGKIGITIGDAGQVIFS